MLYFEDINGSVIVNHDYVNDEYSFEWEGGNRIGISLELLLDANRELLRFEHVIPRPGEKVEIGPYSVIAIEYRGEGLAQTLICDRNIIDSGEE